MQGILNGIKELIEKEYKNNLLTRYENIKTMLESENFTPEPKEVWKLYEDAFSESEGVYSLVTQLFNIDMYDEHGKLNDYCIYLDDIRDQISSYCSAYVLGMKKAEKKIIEK